MENELLALDDRINLPTYKKIAINLFPQYEKDINNCNSFDEIYTIIKTANILNKKINSN